MATHLPERSLNWGNYGKLRAVLAKDSQRQAVLFVHGYGGDALGTWARFHEMLPDEAQCAHHDLFFYDYDGLFGNMDTSSGTFRKLLDLLFENPAAVINLSLPLPIYRPKDFAYDRIVLVAHSLGAAIVRKALLSAWRDKAEWNGKTKLILFAPAHKGASVARIAEQAIGGFRFLPLIAGLWKFKSPLVDELTPGSPYLVQLEQETKIALLAGAPALTADRVFHASNEQIVERLRFAEDPDPVPLDGDHFSICKPMDSFQDPLLAVTKML
jgi:pimeloyl-ACP methyl ester carboxylesterase